jgi:hypothetical protein
MGTGTQDTGGSGGTQLYQFLPETYGALGDNSTDDTAAIKSAVNAAVAYAQANNGYAEVVFGAKTYFVSGATTQSATYKGNAQIPLPLIATTARKIVLVLRGTRDASALYHWEQTTTQNAGSVIRSNLAGTNDGTWGEASVIGGPTPAQGYGSGGAGNVFNNMLIVVDGLSLVIPEDPHVCGFDFRGMAQANMTTGSVLVATGATLIINATYPTQTWQFGYAPPSTNNNANCNVGLYSCEGCYIGLLASEHLVADSVRCIYCAIGIYFIPTTFHGAFIAYACVEACTTALNCQSSATFTKFHVAVLDVEDGSGAWAPGGHVYDPGNRMYGYVGLFSNASPFNPSVTGGANLQVINLQCPTGAVGTIGFTPPAVPASTVAFNNGTGTPMWRNATVTVIGGTVTVIAVDGVATGLTSGTVIVPSGKTITLTYSVAPTWKWVLL